MNQLFTIRVTHQKTIFHYSKAPDIEQGPDGNLYVVSLSDNVIYRISHNPM